MPLVQNFSITQVPGQPSVVTLTDTSTGSDVAITQRRVFLVKDDGTYLVPTGTTTDYILWPYVDSFIDIDALDKDYALNITVNWLNVSNTILYTKTILGGLNGYNEDFDYLLTQMLTGNPPLMNDNVFQKNKSQLRNFIDSGDKAIERASDIFGAQQCYDAGTNLRVNSQYYFNINS